MSKPTKELQESTWELLLEVMSRGEKRGLSSNELTIYHTRLLQLFDQELAKRVEETRINSRIEATDMLFHTATTLKAWQNETGLSLRKFAEYVGIDKATLSRYMNGSTPSVGKICHLTSLYLGRHAKGMIIVTLNNQNKEQLEEEII